MSETVRRLERVLNPRTVAVVGDKRAMGYFWLRNMSTFTGKLYSVQIDPNEIPGILELGVSNYASLLDVPDEVDYVVCAVPRPIAPRIVADCAAKKVGGVSLFTSGFAETGEAEGVRLQEQIAATARDGGLLLIGPNCMGIYNRRLGVRQAMDQPSGDEGDVGFISHSGTHAINFSLLGAAHGVKISKSVSAGNSAVVTPADYLEYMAQDAETKVIGMYLEGVQDGRRFFEVLRRAAQLKPVVVWKGGASEAGQRAMFSHTGGLATSSTTWQALAKQCGVITTESLDETVDVMKALLFARPGTGRRVGLVALTGGQSVVITDAFERAGLEVPLLTEHSYQELAGFFNVIGGSYRNPLDAGGTLGFGAVPENLERMLRILDEDERIDAIAVEVSSRMMARRALGKQGPSIDWLPDMLAAHKQRSAKPFLAVLHPGYMEAFIAEERQKYVEREIPTFAGFQQTASAFAKVVAYRRFVAGLE
ncbi:MAG TPA: CoA-binding protein [Dehalococcoidia bacterium]|nr:CoA-binding protein [Dehalococcoidia bacterium]